GTTAGPAAGGEPDTGEGGDSPLPSAAEALARAQAAGALPEALAQIEREAIIKALDAHRWHRTKTAEALGITFRALRYKLKKLGIE
ncbi:MAG TPA: sigma-54-dependent Fis family transcriptional regulator, partial [Xanthomonadaceae bacterium]|nr:sigma-54-dependent Fis family transcriptional regulator [Xanthomonadaceae bacterium]